MELRGKVCLVTGGTSGIGAATVVALQAKGARVASTARRLPRDSNAAHGEGRQPGSERTRFLQLDMSQPEACREAVEQTVAEFSRLDVLVHCAGGPVPGGLYAVSHEEWMDAFAVHVHAVFHLARAAGPHIALQGGGAIILIGSAAGERGCLGAAAYGVVKGALPHFARVLARELADDNIRVNCVSPGIIRTPFHDSMTPPQKEHNINNRIPLHREGTPADVAALIVCLIENEFITGENVVIDGGMTMRIV
jgi:3-oxoacyl-[acyl-carrier protein] reductase